MAMCPEVRFYVPCPSMSGFHRPTYPSPSSTHRQFTGGREFFFTCMWSSAGLQGGLGMCSGMTASPGGCRPVGSATTTVSVSLPAGQRCQAGETVWEQGVMGMGSLST
jgi:hypothetical protein